MKKLLLLLTLTLTMGLYACDGDGQNGADVDEENFNALLEHLQEELLSFDGYEASLSQPIQAQDDPEGETSTLDATVIEEPGEEPHAYTEEVLDGDVAHTSYYDVEDDLTYSYFNAEATSEEESVYEYYEGFQMQSDFNQMFLMQVSQMQGVISPQEGADVQHTITEFENTFDGEGDFELNMHVDVDEMGEMEFLLTRSDDEYSFTQTQGDQEISMTIEDYNGFFDDWDGIDKEEYEEGELPEDDGLPEDELPEDDDLE